MEGVRWISGEIGWLGPLRKWLEQVLKKMRFLTLNIYMGSGQYKGTQVGAASVFNE